MSYKELGEARILKRYAKQDFLEPVRSYVSQSESSTNWQSLEDASARFLKAIKHCGVARH